VVLSADQKWELAKMLAQRARGQPRIIRKRRLARAMLLAMLAQKQWRRESRSAPCPPWTLRKTIALVPSGPRGA
jgi:hypothetical protein